MSLESRIARLEKDAGGGLCTCPMAQVVVYKPGDPDPPTPARPADGLCPACGGRAPDPYPQVVIYIPDNGRDGGRADP